MARYNDTENTIKAIKKRFNIYHEIPCSQDDRRVQEIIGIVIRTIEAQPIADVVPKSEVEAAIEKLMSATDKVISEAKQEVISDVIEILNDAYRKCDNKEIKTILVIVNAIAELKKKYTGE